MINRKNFVLLLVTICFNLSLNSLVTNIVCFDEANSLEIKKFQIGGFSSVISSPLLVSYNFFIDKTDIFTYEELFLVVPTIYLGFSGRFGINNNLEIGFNFLLSGPSQKEQFGSIHLVGVYSDFNLKKSLKINNISFFAYKINFGINYILPYDAGVDIILKNSFLFGIKKNSFGFNFVPSIKNSIFAGISTLFGAFTYLSITPEILVNFHLFTNKKSIFIFELFILNEFLFHRSSLWDREIYKINTEYFDNINSKFSIGFSFGVCFSNR